MLPREISQYILIDKLGSGGMGEVYLALDKTLNRRVAIKVLSPRMASDWRANRYLRREAQAAAGLDHPNICTIHEVGEGNGYGYIAMQYIDGQTLASVIKEHPLPPNETLSVACQLADALAAAHSVGIVHRDIKPHNIMLTATGQLKVLDFGLATRSWRTNGNDLVLTSTTTAKPAQIKRNPAPAAASDNVPFHIDAEKTISLMSEDASIVGTAPYMSPEQVKGEVIDERTDVFSFGLVIFEALTGKRLFARDTPAAIENAILTEKMPELADAEDKTVRGLRSIIECCIEKQRESRYKNGVELAAALKDLKEQLVNEAGHVVSSRWRTQRLPWIVSICLALVLVLAGVALAKFGREGKAPVIPAKPAVDSIAVLPLRHNKQTDADEYISDGLTVSLINQLSQISTLKVIARNSAFRYKNQEVDLATVGEQLNVRTILVGSIDEQEDDLQVSLTLADTTHKTTLWTRHFASKRDDVLALQSEILRAVTEELRPQSSADLEARFQRRTTQNRAAFDYYLTGIFNLNRRTPEGVKNALDAFQHALKLDPNYALAYSGLADAYSLLDDFSLEAPKVSNPLAEQAANRALEIDPSLGEAHSTLALIDREFKLDWAAAERELKQALELNPNYAITYNRYGWYLISLGRFDEALMNMQKAQELDPRSLNMNTAVGVPYYFAGHSDKAIDEFRRTLQLDPQFYPANVYLAMAFIQTKQYHEAIKIFEQLRKVDNGPDSYVYLGYAYARAGQPSRARQMLDSLKKMSTRRYVPAGDIALLYAQLNDKDQAFAWLDKAYAEHEALTLSKVEPMLEPLRSDPRFQALLRRLKLID